MLLALGATAVVVAVLLSELSLPRVRALLAAAATALRGRWARMRARPAPEPSYDPGRERRAERRARALLRSCVNEEEWAMYRDLGFLRVWGAGGGTAGGAATGDGATGDGATGDGATGDGATGDGGAGGERGADAAVPTYAYLIYPHRPLVAYLAASGALLNEYCVAFPDHTRPYGSARLPDADDVLAKWMALSADERGLIADANMHLPGRQLDPEQVREDLARLARWERERGAGRAAARTARVARRPLTRAGSGAGSVPAR